MGGRGLAHDEEVQLPVDDTENLREVGLEVQLAELGNEPETVAAPVAVAEVLHVEPLAVGAVVEMARRLPVLAERVMEQLLLAVLAQIVDENVETAVGLLQDLVSIFVGHLLILIGSTLR